MAQSEPPQISGCPAHHDWSGFVYRITLSLRTMRIPATSLPRSAWQQVHPGQRGESDRFDLEVRVQRPAV